MVKPNWKEVGSIQGPRGARGPKGDDGEDGITKSTDDGIIIGDKLFLIVEKYLEWTSSSTMESYVIYGDNIPSGYEMDEYPKVTGVISDIDNISPSTKYMTGVTIMSVESVGIKANVRINDRIDQFEEGDELGVTFFIFGKVRES